MTDAEKINLSLRIIEEIGDSGIDWNGATPALLVTVETILRYGEGE